LATAARNAPELPAVNVIVSAPPAMSVAIHAAMPCALSATSGVHVLLSESAIFTLPEPVCAQTINVLVAVTLLPGVTTSVFPPAVNVALAASWTLVIVANAGKANTSHRTNVVTNLEAIYIRPTRERCARYHRVRARERGRGRR